MSRPRMNKAARELLGEVAPSRMEQLGSFVTGTVLFYLLIRQVFSKRLYSEGSHKRRTQ